MSTTPPLPPSGAGAAFDTGAPFDTGLRPFEVRPERPRPVETPWGTFALFADGSEILCVQAFCPHLDGPLFQGTVARGAVTCPWHQWRFDLRTGERVGALGFRLPGRVRRCAVSIAEHGTIVLAPPEGA